MGACEFVFQKVSFRERNPSSFEMRAVCAFPKVEGSKNFEISIGDINPSFTTSDKPNTKEIHSQPIHHISSSPSIYIIKL
jgi:hypothetical protein